MLPLQMPVIVTAVSFSDHSLVECHFNCSDFSTPPTNRRIGRNLRKINIELFRRDIAALPWDSLSTIQDATLMWSNWLQLFMGVLDRHAPLRQHLPRKKPCVEWMDSQLLALISKRNRLHKKYIKQNRSQDAYERFSAARAEVTKYNRALKSEYFKTRCESANNSRALWKVINTVTGRNQKHVPPACTAQEISDVFAEIVTDASRPQVILTPLSTFGLSPLPC